MRRAGLMFSVTILAAGVAVLGPKFWPLPKLPVPLVQPYQSTVVIPGDFFTPAAMVINAGDSVTWVNKDTDMHMPVTAPGAPEAFALEVYPGESVTHKFTRPGVYVYYCQDHATFDPQLHRVVAEKGSYAFPIAMEGIIVVKGPGLTGGPSASINISEGVFSPDIAVVQAGWKVTWTNADTDEHDVTWAPVGTGNLGRATSADAPLLVLPVGTSRTATFARPGVYFYYCECHTVYDARLELSAAVEGARAFPVSMEGYVIVL
jgi:plastocyanin